MRKSKTIGEKYKSSTHYILAALVPYTEANIKLSFKPGLFFDDLEKMDKLKVSRKSLRTSYHRAIKRELISIDDQGYPRLTYKGLRKVKRYKAKKLGQNARLLLIFDIPEEERWKRDRLRILLRELSFKKVQQSVWECKFDHREYIKSEIEEIGLQNSVIVYEALKTKI